MAKRGCLLGLGLLLVSSTLALGENVPTYQQVVTITDAGSTVIIDFSEDGIADVADMMIVCNTGSVPVVCVPQDVMPAYSTTAKFPYAGGECRTFDRRTKGPKYSHLSCITASGTSTTVGLYAEP